ncbi:helix-turn-helix transcriptional regulator [Nonlabens mediterrranea]|uniref:Helix-turn-helix transcriptional regulator n=1 Tax=Nonlabens mediterrranea TaxID=1419947 RepID=A0ABS0A4I2_9FLAO|nr:putative transcriptional regulator, luxR family [Flavobacteria bacterium BBFL7]MBF4984253.1 helix-turn-helix transcriptional regulator [Nonlabens mediterrranea]MBF4985069.1 helix-turn-helix transcriptional regulator [Nonlabens mediterrranea]
MNLFTEKEYHQQSQHFAFRLRNLYLHNRSTFFQLQDYLPSPTYINYRDSHEYEFFSKSFFSYGKEIETLYELGKSYLPEISNIGLMKKAINKAEVLHKNNDYESVCSYMQIISMNREMTPYFTNKILIDRKLTLNTSLFLNEYEHLENIFKEIIPWGKENLERWNKFQTLTKREKEILKLFAKGKSNKEVSEILILSVHSVHTHKKNIYQKLDISKASELVKISLALEII